MADKPAPDKNIENNDKSYKVTEIKNGQVLQGLDEKNFENDQHRRRSFVSSIGGAGGGNNLLFGEMYILPNVPKGRSESQKKL